MKNRRFFLNYFYTIAYLFLIVNIFFYFPSGDCFAVSIHFSLKTSTFLENFTIIHIFYILHFSAYILPPSNSQSGTRVAIRVYPFDAYQVYPKRISVNLHIFFIYIIFVRRHLQT
ncbi:hypothetical protein EBB54_20185 [Schaedlerella arabinosiphila]|uniref:Uncharacterized protein n=1 Tax=Schaedlerella arabinosiphila TaxID=2044587 RepID=A0A3R8JPJ9_9FIRM|nr:hypothetical protein EBB54_20185 [Schaedlerella arabinosiphila]